MKNMKKLPLIVLIGSLSACGGSDIPGLAASGGPVLLQETTVATTPAPDDSKAFLVAAYQDGLAEIDLAQLAVQQATNENVKKFAQRMIEHHTAINNQITQLAQRKNVALPTTPSADLQAQRNTLSALAGNAFDLAYMQQNVAVHEKDAVAARQQARQGTDVDVKRLARSALPILEVHLAAAEETAALLSPASFLATAFRAGLAEVQLSQLALQKASNAEVRAFAQRMVDEHTQANAQITSLAQQEGTTLPTAPSAEQQAVATELSGFTGPDFDEAFMDANVIAHVKTVRLFRRQAQQGQDAAVKSFAAGKQSTLTGHLVAAIETDGAVTPSFPFLVFQDGEAEIALSQLALQRASSADVKTFAQSMIDAHTTANAQLQAQAQQANRQLPTDVAPEHLLALAALLDRRGREFDQTYMELAAGVHERDVKAATAATQQTADAFSNSVAQVALPILNDHLARARALRDQVENAQQ
ncbi:DUF4142 domain-containing protein [Noviherbaspirillum denitrificans]|uniref:DUF4142 domain-containing protein n=1 Tax=Noviherbaspirillum denitrificans TaxID=1968433 RepID=A0A254TFQ7_9BURK|nr:DUF4142 domain-containing protein [Noviherbaspirillum denitrificans]OWW21486.1 hypothetical protein AYR66_20345 [Noviherbaspirillum denitrificans]